jgi:pyruvate dehydrogenase E2 component (dihydrolipoamide acetyltransferase)
MSIVKLGVPKWGLSMTEGKLVEWLVDEGAELEPGAEVAEVRDGARINRRRRGPRGRLVPATAGRGCSGRDAPRRARLLGVIADDYRLGRRHRRFSLRTSRPRFVPEETEEEGSAG